MATKTNKESLKKATKKLWAKTVQEAISWAWLQGAAISALQTPTTEPTKPVQPDAPIDTRTWAPAVQTQAPAPVADVKIEPQKVVEPIKVSEPPKIEEIKPAWLPQSIEEWKTQGSNIADLESMIETKYWTVATSKDWVLTANIEWVDYQWNIDAAWNPIKTRVWWESSQDIYTRLMAWEAIEDTWITQTPEYTNAKARYDIVSKYMWMTEDQLYSAYVGWQIWSTLEKELINNPYLAAAKEKYNQKIIADNINDQSYTMLDAYNRADWTYQAWEEVSFLEELSNKITESLNNQSKDVLSFKDFMATNYPDLVSDTRELNQKNEDLQRLVDERDARLDEIIKENPWISINRATMLAARQNKDTNAQIKSMSYEIGNLQANINYQTTMADKEFWYEQDNQARADALQAEQRWMAFNALQTAQWQEFQREQIADQRAYEQANAWVKTQIITDPATWQQALINSSTWEVITTYETGLKPDTMTAAQEAQYNLDVAKFWLETAKFNLEAWVSEPVVPTWNIGTISYTNEFWTTKNVNVDNVASPSLLTAFNAMWDTAIVWNWYRTREEQQALYDAYQAWTGWLAAAPWTSKHETWMAIDLYGWTDKDGNLLKPTAEQVKIMKENWWEQIAWEEDLWHFEYTWVKDKALWTGFDTATIPQYSNYLTTWKVGTNKDEMAQIAKQFGSVEEFKRQAEEYNNSKWWPREKDLIKIKKLKDDVSSFLSEDNEWALSNSVWAIQQAWSPWTALERENFLWEVQTFLSKKTLQNLIDVKSEWATFGALSNEELRMLQAAWSKLSSLINFEEDGATIKWFKGSEKNFKKIVQQTVDEYDRLIKIAEERMWKEHEITESTWWRKYVWETTTGAWTTITGRFN